MKQLLGSIATVASRRREIGKLRSFAGASASLALLAILASPVAPAGAGEVRVLSAAAMQTVLNDIRSEFERTSGHKLNVIYDTMGAITQRVRGGQTPDIVI